MRRLATCLAGVVVFVGVGPVSAEHTLTFDDVDASGGPITGAALDTYLAPHGITISDISPSGLCEIVDDRVGGASQVLRATSDYNVFWHDSPNEPYSYTVNFSSPLDSFTFTRVELFGATSSGLIVSPWRARAYDSGDGLLGTVSEGTLRFYGTTPAQTFTFDGPDIAKVVFDRTTHNYNAGLNRVPTDNWVLDPAPSPIPTPSTLVGLLSMGILGLIVAWRRRRKKAG